MEKTVVLIHGRHLETEGWKTLVWGDGEKIGTAALGLAIALPRRAKLIFGTGASVRDGLKECEYTRKFLEENIDSLITFPEFESYRIFDSRDRAEIFLPVLTTAHMDTESMDTIAEVKNALAYARQVGAKELITVTSPFHYARCSCVVGKLLEEGFDFGEVQVMTVSAKSSTEKCRAATTVILEHSHRGDDPMVASPLAPHEVFPRMFKLPPRERMKFFTEIAERLRALGV